MSTPRFKVDRNLHEWLNRKKEKHFPLPGYKTRYQGISDYLGLHVHEEVVMGALFAKLRNGDCSVDQVPYFNKHGKEHVAAVIEKASGLLEASGCELTAYEAYVLLSAIQLHDVGLVFGRDDHEKKCRIIFHSMGMLAGTDEPEKRTITSIASAHGGLNSVGGKDTISELGKENDLLGQKVRTRLLAAILRLADELADGFDRTAVSPIDFNLLPEESKIYHVYSRCLHSVMLDKNEIRMSFDIEEDVALEEFIKDGKKIYLLDEIYPRTLKVYRELRYCMRFMRPHFEINLVKVEIKIYPGKGRELLPPEVITYTLEETGYPEEISNICNMIPTLERCSGAQMKEKILTMWRA